MNKTIQTSILVFAFLLSVLVGYILVGRLVEGRSGTEDAEKEMTVPDGSNLAPRVMEVETPEYQAKTGLYSFRARGEGNDIVFYLADSNQNLVKNSAQHTTDALFEVEPTASGIYYVYVVDATNRHSEMVKVEGCSPRAVASVKKVTRDELMEVLMEAARSKDTNPARKKLDGRISPSCKYICQGLAEEEKAPISYVEIISRLKRSWASIAITGIDYDANGRVKSVDIVVTQK